MKQSDAKLIHNFVQGISSILDDLQQQLDDLNDQESEHGETVEGGEKILELEYQIERLETAFSALEELDGGSATINEGLK